MMISMLKILLIHRIRLPHTIERGLMPSIIAISNEKGGVAKTTTALSLGASLAEFGQRTLLIDLDPQANLTLAFGNEPGQMENTIGSVLMDAKTSLQTILETSFPGLLLIPSNSNLEEAVSTLSVSRKNIFQLRNTLTSPSFQEFDFILIDCPPSLGFITHLALVAANLLVIPTQSEYFSAYALRNMMALIREIRNDSNPNLAYRILITLFDRRNRAHRDIQTQLLHTFGEGLFKTIIEVDTKLRESPIIGLPINQYRPTSRGALQYRNLAEELLIYVEKTNTEST
jgi:chromosome partitioning protein